MTKPRLVEAVGAVVQPSVNVLTTGSQDNPEEPAVATGGLSLKEMEVVFLAFDGAFGTSAGSLVAQPERTGSGDEGMEAVVDFGIGVDDAAIGRTGASLAEVRTGGQRFSLLAGG